MYGRPSALVTLAAFLACSPPPEQGRAAAGNAETDQPAPEVSGEAPVVLFLGTSLTAGLGVSPDEAYPTLIQEKMDAAGLRFRVVNAGVSGETSAGGLRRIDWLVRQPISVLVVELGANDVLRGQDLDSTRANLQAIIDRTRAQWPRAAIVLAGMQAPPNLGRRYTQEFRNIYPDLARRNRTALVPFLLQDVGGVSELNQGDGIHPNARGHEIMAETVWRVLRPILQDRQ